eukprot:scaffold43263_cov76-Phaeocystis_antarctica.AAC.1
MFRVRSTAKSLESQPPGGQGSELWHYQDGTLTMLAHSCRLAVCSTRSMRRETSDGSLCASRAASASFLLLRTPERGPGPTRSGGGTRLAAARACGGSGGGGSSPAPSSPWRSSAALTSSSVTRGATARCSGSRRSTSSPRGSATTLAPPSSSDSSVSSRRWTRGGAAVESCVQKRRWPCRNAGRGARSAGG